MKPFKSNLQLILERPATVTFFLSLVLSFIARWPRETLNRDGMLYVDTARIFAEEGLAAALGNFDWIAYPVLIGLGAQVTGLPYEAVGHMLGALLLAGACAVMVKQVQVFMPQCGWLACLVVLSLPAMNAFRDDILRENGYWFFILLAFWIASRNPAQPGLLRIFLPTVALGAGALFRVEAIAFYPALTLWQWCAMGEHRTWKNSLRLLIIPVAVLGAAILALFLDVISLGRLDYYWQYFSTSALERFDAHAERLAHAALSHYAYNEANQVLFFGLLGLLLSKYIASLGLLAAPLFYGLLNLRNKSFSLQPFGWLFLTYFLIALLFLINMFFASSRYIAPLGILSVPLIVFGLNLIWRRFPRLRALFMALLVLISLDNVISLGSQKNHIVEAGQWLQEQGIAKQQAFIDDSRVAYHAGWGFSATPISRDQAYTNSDYHYLVITSPENPETWLEGKDLKQLSIFTHKRDGAIIILQKTETD